MLSSSSFDKNIYAQLKFIVQTQRELSHLNNENVNEIGNRIFKEIEGDTERIYVFSQILLDFAEYRPKNIELLADLFIFLQKMKSQSNNLEFLDRSIVSFIHHRSPSRLSSIFLIRTLFLKESISFDMIVNEIYLIYNLVDEKKDIKNQQFDDDFLCKNSLPNLAVNLTRIINWFYPELHSSNKNIIKMAKSMFNYFFPRQYKNQVQLKLMLQRGYCLDMFAEIIQKDDIDSFIKIVGQMGNNFDINKRIKSTIFERSSFLLYNPTLIQYSAFFNSIKIFKYLLLNNASIEKTQQDHYSLVDYAVAGGSIEIIHILEQKGIQLLDSIPISIKYYQNDIFLYILDNCCAKQAQSQNNVQKSQKGAFDAADPFFYFYDFDENKFYKNVLNNFINENMKINSSHNFGDEIEENYKQDLNVREYSNVRKKEYQEGKDVFEYIKINKIFKAIVESNNYLPLFLLFDHKMHINYRSEKSGKTILHYSVRKGKLFLSKLLLSAKSIDPFIPDSNGEIPIMYSILFNRKKIFLYMINHPKIKNSLIDQEYIKMLFYSNVIKCSDEIYDDLSKKWKVNLVELIDLFDQPKILLDVITYVPFELYKDQIANAIRHSFKVRKIFLIRPLVYRVIMEKSFYIKGEINFLNIRTRYDIEDQYKLQLFDYLRRRHNSEFINYNSLYNEVYDPQIDWPNISIYNKRFYQNSIKFNCFYVVNDENNICAKFAFHPLNKKSKNK